MTIIFYWIASFSFVMHVPKTEEKDVQRCFIIPFGHPHKMFHFSSPSNSKSWVGQSVGEIKEEEDI